MVKSEVAVRADDDSIADKARIQSKHDKALSRRERKRERKRERNKSWRRMIRESRRVPTDTLAKNSTIITTPTKLSTTRLTEPTTTTTSKPTITTATKTSTTATKPTTTTTTTTTKINPKSSPTPAATNRTTTTIKSPTLQTARTLKEVFIVMEKQWAADEQKAAADARAREAAKSAPRPTSIFDLEDSSESESDSE